jgi:hypothetical protein
MVSIAPHAVLGLAMMTGLWVTIVSLHISGSRQAAVMHTSLLLQQDRQRR